MNKITLYTPLPANFEGTMEKYFTSITYSSIRIPEIKKLKNVFVSNQGLVIKNCLLVKGCAFNLLGKEDNTFYYTYWKHSLEQMLVCKYGSSLKSLNLNDNSNYLLIHSKWFNYSFWINSFLVRLIQAEEAGLLPSVKLIYPEEWNRIAFVTESLKCFNIDKQVIPYDTHIFVKNLIMPETRDWTSSFYPEHILKVCQKVLPFAKINSTIKDLPKRIYLSRKKQNNRSVENERELYSILSKYQFSIINFEDYSFWDQVMMMSNAELFISIHGAGFSNILFMNKGSKVLELVNRAYADVEYKFPFWKLAGACQLQYFVQFGNVLNGANSKLLREAVHLSLDQYLVNQNIYIDPKLFEQNIQSMLK